MAQKSDEKKRGEEGEKGDSYLQALERLKKQWESCMNLHAYLHEGEEQEHGLEASLIELEKSIIRVYGRYGVDKIDTLTKSDMLQEVQRLRETPPRWARDTALEIFSLIPHNPAVRALELTIAELEVSKPVRAEIDTIENMAAPTEAEPIEIDEKNSQVRVRGEPIGLTGPQLRIFAELYKHRGEPVPLKRLKSNPETEERPDRIIDRINGNFAKHKLTIRIQHVPEGYKLP